MQEEIIEKTNYILNGDEEYKIVHSIGIIPYINSLLLDRYNKGKEECKKEYKDDTQQLTELDVKMGKTYRYYDLDGTKGVLMRVIKYKGKVCFEDIETPKDDGYYSGPTEIINYFKYNIKEEGE